MVKKLLPVLFFAFVLLFVSCGASSYASLKKEAISLGKDYQTAMTSNDIGKLTNIAEKSINLSEKLEKADLTAAQNLEIAGLLLGQ